MPIKKKIFASVFCLFIILTIVIIWGSIRVVEPEEYAIPYNNLWKTVGNRVLIQGRYYLGLYVTLKKYPMTFQPIDFTQKSFEINCMSNDGMVVVVDIISQYKFIPEGLVDILYMYDENADEYIKIMAKSAFISTCSYYEVESGFIQNRLNISNQVLIEFKKKLKNINLALESQFAELRDFEYPVDYLDAITDKQVAYQQIELLLSKRPVLVKNAETEYLNAIQQSRIEIQKANREAESIKQAANSTADSIYSAWKFYADSFNYTLSKLNMDPDEFVEKYLSTVILDDVDNMNPIYLGIS